MNIKNKRIAITGITGFIGSHLANTFENLGAEIFGMAREQFYNPIITDKVNMFYGDVSNKSDVDYFIQKSKPDIFIHLAAQTQAPFSIKYPYETIKTNSLGTLNVLEGLRQYEDCQAIIVGSSDKTYGELLSEEYLEDHILNGVYPYDASKSITDVLSRSYKETYGLPVLSIRHCNVYGPGDFNYLRIVPGIMRASITGETVTIRNGGKDVREYIHIDDVTSAYAAIIKNFKENKDILAFNIGSGDRLSTIDVFNIINEVANKTIKHTVESETGKELSKQVISHKLLSEKTGWNPSIRLQDSASDILEWYRQHDLLVK